MVRYYPADLKEAVTHEGLQDLGDWVRLRMVGSILVKLCGFDIETALEKFLAAAKAGDIRIEAPPGRRPEDVPWPPGLAPSARADWRDLITEMWFEDHRVCLDDLLHWAKYSPPEEKSPRGRPSKKLKEQVINDLVGDYLTNGADWDRMATATEKTAVHRLLATRGAHLRELERTISETQADSWVREAKKRASEINEREFGNPRK